MEYNLLANLQYCGDIVSEMSGLLYYTHIPAGFLALFVGLFVLYKTRSRAGLLLFMQGAIFALWVSINLILWLTFDQNTIMIALWSLLGILSALLFYLTHWFAHSYITNTPLPTWMHAMWLLLFLPILIISPAGYLSGVDIRECVAAENQGFVNYFYSLGVVAMLFIGWALYSSYRKKSDANTRSAKLLVFAGAELFLLAFLVTGTLSSYLVGAGLIPDFGLEQYGLVMMPVFMGVLAYATVRYHAFNLKLLGAQALVVSLIVLIASEFLFIRTPGNQALVAVTLFLAILFGFFLVRGVKREVEQREQIEKQEKELELVNREQESLLHFISHEVKGYLTESQAGFASIVEGDYGAVPAQVKSMAENALGNVRRGVSTVMDILSASDLKKGSVLYAKKPFDLKALVSEVIAELKPAADEKGLSFDIRIGEGEFKTIGDEHKLKQHAIRNLIDNAIKYTPKGAIRIELIHSGDKFRFTVEDNGVGITPEDMKNLFTEGGHGKDSLKVNVHSTGYGLYIAKRVVEAHGGRISAESAGGGKGARFIVELPGA